MSETISHISGTQARSPLSEYRIMEMLNNRRENDCRSFAQFSKVTIRYARHGNACRRQLSVRHSFRARDPVSAYAW